MPIVAPRLVVGLGNPGAEYEDNRHNLGFWFIDQLAVIVGGRVAFRGEPEALRRQPDGRPQSLDAALRDLYTQEADA